MQKLVKTGKYTEINKQSHVKFEENIELAHTYLAVTGAKRGHLSKEPLR